MDNKQKLAICGTCRFKWGSKCTKCGCKIKLKVFASRLFGGCPEGNW